MRVSLDKVYCCDFETNNSNEAIETGETFVWLWDSCNCKNLKHYGGTSIYSFFEWLNSFEDHRYFYFHNLKFDGSFMLNFILQYCTWVEVEKLDDLKECECTTIIDARQIYYRIAFRTANGGIVEIRDSSKKIPGTVESIAKSWNLPILKGSIDYKQHHTKDYQITEEDLSYIHNDTEIIARVLRELYKEGMTYLTASADSFNAYKKCIGKDNFDLLFPVLPLEQDAIFRKAYNGGLCFFNPDYLDEELDEVYCYDVNSMYPHKMAEAMLPYGTPLVDYGEPKERKGYKLFITHVKAYIRVKPECYPVIMKKMFMASKNTYITDTDGEMIDLYLTSVDYYEMLRAYDVLDIEYYETYYFRGSRNMFKRYILPLYDIKCNSTGAQKLLAKLKLNSLYGRFALNPNRSTVKPFLENGVLKTKIIRHFEVDSIYTPLSAFVTAYARAHLMQAIERHHDEFVYCDTDSIHLVCKAKEDETFIVDKNRLGCWDLEKEYSLFRVIAQKTYYGILKDGKEIIKACGASQAVKKNITYDRFNLGETFSGKLRPKQVKGGVVLVDTTFTFKPR